MKIYAFYLPLTLSPRHLPPNKMQKHAFLLNEMIDTTNMCSHLQRKLFNADGEYRAIREQIENDPELTAVVRSRQLHIYRNGKKILILAGKSAPKIIRDDELTKNL